MLVIKAPPKESLAYPELLRGGPMTKQWNGSDKTGSKFSRHCLVYDIFFQKGPSDILIVAPIHCWWQKNIVIFCPQHDNWRKIGRIPFDQKKVRKIKLDQKKVRKIRLDRRKVERIKLQLFLTMRLDLKSDKDFLLLSAPGKLKQHLTKELYVIWQLTCQVIENKCNLPPVGSLWVHSYYPAEGAWWDKVATATVIP